MLNRVFALNNNGDCVLLVQNILPFLDSPCLLGHTAAALRLVASTLAKGLNSQFFWRVIYRWRWCHCHINFKNRLVCTTTTTLWPSFEKITQIEFELTSQSLGVTSIFAVTLELYRKLASCDPQSAKLLLQRRAGADVNDVKRRRKRLGNGETRTLESKLSDEINR